MDYLLTPELGALNYQLIDSDVKPIFRAAFPRSGTKFLIEACVADKYLRLQLAIKQSDSETGSEKLRIA